MESLIIKLSTTLLETVNNDTIHNLYTTAKTLKDENKLVDLEGNLLSSSAYENDVNYLTTTFPNLYITASTLYVSFEDPEVERLLKLYGYGDSIGIRTSDLLTITRLNPNGKFADYSIITSFNELSKFINLKRIYTEDFKRTDNLTSIDLSNIERIDDRAFLLSGIQTVNAPNLTTLANDAFNSSKVTTVTSLGEITEIPAGCFSGCSYLTSVNIPDTCTNVKNIAFQNCTALTSINLNNLTRTDNATFKGCTSLATVTSSDNLTSVGYQSFLNCSSLLSIDLTNATTLSYGSFDGCTSLLSVTLSNEITEIPDYCFKDTALTSFDFSNIRSVGKWCFYNSKLAGALSIPNLSIDLNRAEFRNTEISSITNLGSITAISYDARSGLNEGTFLNCTLLTSVTIPSSVTYIGHNSFSGCTNLSQVTCNWENITYIGSSGFGSISVDWNFIVNLANLTSFGPTNPLGAYRSTRGIKQLYLPKITNTGTTAYYSNSAYFRGWFTGITCDIIYFRDLVDLHPGDFSHCHCINLVINNITPPVWKNSGDLDEPSDDTGLKSRVFSGSTITNIYVPDSAVTTYQNDVNWSSVASKIKALSTLNKVATESDLQSGVPALIEAYM